MEENIFAAFSFSGAPRIGAASGSGASLSNLGNIKKGRGYSVKARTHSRGSGVSHAVAPVRRVQVKVNDEGAGEGLGVKALDSDVTEGGGSFTSAPRIRISDPPHQTLAKVEKREAIDQEESKVMCASHLKEENRVKGDDDVRAEIQINEEHQVKRENRLGAEIQFTEENQNKGEFLVKEENQEPERPASVVNRKRLSHWNTHKEQEICDEIEDLGGLNGLRWRRADSEILKVKKDTMKRQNTKVLIGSKCGSIEVRGPPPNWEEAIQKIR